MEKIIIASGPVIVKDNKVLLDLSGQDNFWKFIGGKVKDLDSESLPQVAIRRAKEELGIDIFIKNPEPFIMHTTKEKDGQTINIILVHYLAEMSSDAQIVLGEGVRESAWLDLYTLVNDNTLAPNILPTLRHFGFIS